MKLEVTIIGTNSKVSKQNFNLSLPAIVKHLAFSGCHFMSNKFKILRCLGMLFHYIFYLQEKSLNNDKFSLPPDCLYDPTEKGQFSNLAGKAIANYLSEKIDKSMFSVSYEAAMKVCKHPIAKQRPDLLAFPNNSMFAIEAKGYSDRYCSNKKVIACCNNKFNGCPFNIQFCVASVSYDLYDKIKCNYYKNQPNNTNPKPITSNNILRDLRKAYYSEFAKLVNIRDKNIKIFSKEEFYIIDLHNLYFIEFPLKIWWTKLLDFYELKLIIPKNVKEYAENGLMNESPFEYEGDDSIYISNDRIGLKIKELIK